MSLPQPNLNTAGPYAAAVVPFLLYYEQQRGFQSAKAVLEHLLTFATASTSCCLAGFQAYLKLTLKKQIGAAVLAISPAVAFALHLRRSRLMQARFECGHAVPDPSSFIRSSLGVFDVGGHKYYKSTVISVPQLLTPTSVKITDEGSVDAKTIVEYTLSPLETGSSESVLAQRPLPRGLLACDRPKWLVNVGVCEGPSGLRGIGMGWREGAFLFFARHIIHAPNLVGYDRELVFYTEHSSVRVTPTAENTFTLDNCPKNYKNSGWDLVAMKLPPNTWSVLGAGSCTSKAYVANGEGPVIVYGNPDGDTLVSAGAVLLNLKANKKGLVSHNASTTHCFSGSPLVTHHGGCLKILGAHICGVTEGLGDTHNHGVSYWSIWKLRKQLGLVEPLVLNPPVESSESKEKGRKQEEWNWDDPDEDQPDDDEDQYGEDDYEDEDEIRARGDRGATKALRKAQGGVFEYVAADVANARDRVNADHEHRLHGDGGTRHHIKADGKQANAQPGTWRAEKDPSESPSKDTLDGTFDWLTSTQHEAIKLSDVLYYYYAEGWGPVPTSEALFSLFQADARFITQSCPVPKIALAHSPLEPIPESSPAPAILAPAASASVAQESPLPGPPKDSSQSVAVEWFPLTNGAQKSWKDAKPSPEAPPHTFTPPGTSEPTQPAELTAIIHKVLKGDLTSLPDLIGKDADTVFNHAALTPLRDYITNCGAEWSTPKNSRAKTVYHDADGKACFTRCGAYKCYSKNKGRTSTPICMSPEFIHACKKHGIDLTAPDGRSSFVLPPKGGEGVGASLKGQASRQRVGNYDRLSFEDFQTWCSSYPTSDCPSVTDTIPALEKLIASFDPSKSAGWSANSRPGTKCVWMEGDARTALVELTLCRLIMRSVCSPRLGNMSPMEMCKMGLTDPRVLFTKSEAHALAKADENRWRLIWSISVVDTLCQLIPHNAQNKADIAAYQEGTLNMQGIGMGHHDDGIQRTGQVFEWLGELGLLLESSDASGWDLSVCRDAIMLDAERRMRLSNLTDPRELNTLRFLLYTEALCNSAHVVAFDGQLWESDRFGITASGIPSTSCQNSPIRTLQFLACGGKRGHSVGDDLIGAGASSRELLESCGTIIKGEPTYSPPEGPHSLTSHTYSRPGPPGTPWQATFENFNKLLAHVDLRRVPGCAPADDQLKGCLQAIRADERQTVTFRAILSEMGWRSDLPAEDVCSDAVY